jgi:hypothetical protein
MKQKPPEDPQYSTPDRHSEGGAGTTHHGGYSARHLQAALGGA